MYKNKLLKAEDPADYASRANSGVLLGYPVRINGQHARPDNGVDYHSSIKYFDESKDHPHAIHNLAQHLPLNPPDAKHTQIEPGQFKDRNGSTVYVLKLSGNSADKIKEHNGKFAHMGFPANYEWTPHVSVDKATHDRIKSSGAKTAHDAGIEFGAAQLKKGPQVLKTYHHEPDTTDPRVPDEGDMTAKIPYKAQFNKSEKLCPAHKAEEIHGKSESLEKKEQPPSNEKQYDQKISDRAASRIGAHEVPEFLTPQHKEKGISALKNHTHTRKNPKTGETEHLLFRGTRHHDEKHTKEGVASHPYHTAWTYKPSTAHSYAAVDSMDSLSGGKGKKDRTIAAFVPESQLHNVIDHDNSHHGEVIVKPNDKKPLKIEEVAHPGLHARGLESPDKTTTPFGTKVGYDTVKKSENVVGKTPLMKPYVSEAQRRWAHTSSGEEALGGKSGVHEWDEATKGKKLPERVGKSEQEIKSLIKKEHSLHSRFNKALALTGDTLKKYIEDNHDLRKALEGK